MVFSSMTFLVLFLPMTLCVYFLIPKNKVRLRNLSLLVFSLIFYGFGEPKYILVMIFSILLNYVLAILIEEKEKKKLILCLDIILNVLILGFFKYTNLVIETINLILKDDISLIKLALPIGISFYTFQIMSYVIDCYRGKVKANRDLISLATYITLFPQLIAGPIVRYKDVENSLNSRKVSLNDISIGIKRFIVGLSKKVLIANQVGIIFDEIYEAFISGTQISIGAAWLSALSFTFQIYYDFSGYSDMAIGLGRILGFKYLENFNYPYISKSITEFWRRWHISLSSWFKEYVYIPLGGNKKGKLRQIFNILIVWALTGLWHGASYNFIIWGIYYAVLLIMEKLFLGKLLEKAPPFISSLYTIFFIMIGWVIFKITDLDILLSFLKSMFSGYFRCEIYDYYVRSRFILLLIAIIGSAPIIKNIALKIEKNLKDYQAYLGVLEFVIFGLLLLTSISFIVSGTYNPFLYFRF